MKFLKFILGALILLTVAASGYADGFSARVTRVTDGDTFRFSANILNVRVEDTCRMNDYNAPELRGKEREQGLVAKQHLHGLIFGQQVLISAEKRDKYGRWLCDVRLGDESVNRLMRAHLKDYPGLDKYKRLYRRTASTTDTGNVTPP